MSVRKMASIAVFMQKGLEALMLDPLESIELSQCVYSY